MFILFCRAFLFLQFPSFKRATHFSVETVYAGGYTPIGVHKSWMYLRGDKKKKLEELYQRCPEIKIIGPRLEDV